MFTTRTINLIEKAVPLLKGDAPFYGMRAIAGASAISGLHIRICGENFDILHESHIKRYLGIQGIDQASTSSIFEKISELVLSGKYSYGVFDIENYARLGATNAPIEKFIRPLKAVETTEEIANRFLDVNETEDTRARYALLSEIDHPYAKFRIGMILLNGNDHRSQDLAKRYIEDSITWDDTFLTPMRLMTHFDDLDKSYLIKMVQHLSIFQNNPIACESFAVFFDRLGQPAAAEEIYSTFVNMNRLNSETEINNYNGYNSLERHQFRMINAHIAGTGIDDNIITAMFQLPRVYFIPKEAAKFAFVDSPVNIGENQTISQPSLVAMMTQLLQVTPDSKVLEIGTGSFYQSAILSLLSKEIYTVELNQVLFDRALCLLEQLKKDSGFFTNVNMFKGDGSYGLKKHAPYDRIIVTAAAKEVPKKLLQQLADGGIMIIPIGPSVNETNLTLIKKQGNEIIQNIMDPVRFVPLLGEYSQ